MNYGYMESRPELTKSLAMYVEYGIEPWQRWKPKTSRSGRRNETKRGKIGGDT